MEELDTAQWYVLQVMSGQENRVSKTLQERAAAAAAIGKDYGIEELVVPTELVADRRSDGSKVVRERKLYPGYVLVKLHLYDESGQLNPDTWGLFRETNGIIGFIGGEEPVQLPQHEVDMMLKQGEEEQVAPKPAVEFTLGELVVIREGAFENIEGTVVKIDQERQILGVSINMFGSSTIVEIDYRQVDRSVK
jgi:transcriptional antiterminator NusG